MKKNSWTRLLAYVTGLINQELLLKNEYLAAENRIRGPCPYRKFGRVYNRTVKRRMTSGSLTFSSAQLNGR